MRRYSLLPLFLFGVIGLVFADYYGTFPNNPVGEFMDGPDRPLFKLHKEFVYSDPNQFLWSAPKDEIIDGASIPKFAWSMVGGPFSGNYFKASIIHDYFCCTKSRNYYDTHETFRRGMRASGVSKFKAYLMWVAVRFAGPDKWEVDPESASPKPCKSRVNTPNGYAQVSDRAQSMAVAKYTGIARTLKTTNGNVLDVVNDELVFSDSEQAQGHLDNLHVAIREEFDYPINKLGLFSIIREEELEDPDKIQGWQPGQIPPLDKYMAENGMDYEYTNKDVVDEVYRNPWEMDISELPML